MVKDEAYWLARISSVGAIVALKEASEVPYEEEALAFQRALHNARLEEERRTVSSTVRKSTVEFRVIATGTFMVEHEDGESPANVLAQLVAEKKLSYVDLHLHSSDFEWKCEVFTGDQDDQEWFDRTVHDEAPADSDELYRRQADEQDAELRERDRMEREEIGDAMREQWEQR